MSPRSSEQLEIIREQSREKIMMAALELFAHRGFHNTSIEMIRKQAKVSKGLIYNYFDSKEALLQAIVEHLFKEKDGYAAEILAQPGPKARLKKVIDLSIDLMKDRYDYTKLVTSLALQLDQFPDLTKQIQDQYKLSVPFFRQLLGELGMEEPEQEGKALAALLDGLGMQYIILKDEAPVEEMRQYLYRRFQLEERATE